MLAISMAFNYSMFKFPFKSENVGREREKLQKFEYEDNEEFFLQNKKHFLYSEGLSFGDIYKNCGYRP